MKIKEVFLYYGGGPIALQEPQISEAKFPDLEANTYPSTIIAMKVVEAVTRLTGFPTSIDHVSWMKGESLEMYGNGWKVKYYVDGLYGE